MSKTNSKWTLLLCGFTKPFGILLGLQVHVSYHEACPKYEASEGQKRTYNEVAGRQRVKREEQSDLKMGPMNRQSVERLERVVSEEVKKQMFRRPFSDALTQS